MLEYTNEKARPHQLRIVIVRFYQQRVIFGKNSVWIVSLYSMEPQLEIIAGLGPQACKYKIDQDLWPVWHYHPEYDILLNLNRSGSYLVGDRLGTFKPGTLIINGSNIPHAFHASEAPPTDHGPAMIILFFSRASLGEELLARSEMAPIRGLLDELKTGFEIT
ncbi:MAG: hypothetical protein ACI97B_005050, partial [Verrucomicrobiales bacterium]